MITPVLGNVPHEERHGWGSWQMGLMIGEPMEVFVQRRYSPSWAMRIGWVRPEVWIDRRMHFKYAERWKQSPIWWWEGRPPKVVYIDYYRGAGGWNLVWLYHRPWRGKGAEHAGIKGWGGVEYRQVRGLQYFLQYEYDDYWREVRGEMDIHEMGFMYGITLYRRMRGMWQWGVVVGGYTQLLPISLIGWTHLEVGIEIARRMDFPWRLPKGKWLRNLL